MPLVRPLAVEAIGRTCSTHSPALRPPDRCRLACAVLAEASQAWCAFSCCPLWIAEWQAEVAGRSQSHAHWGAEPGRCRSPPSPACWPLARCCRNMPKKSTGQVRACLLGLMIFWWQRWHERPVLPAKTPLRVEHSRTAAAISEAWSGCFLVMCALTSPEATHMSQSGQWCSMRFTISWFCISRCHPLRASLSVPGS